MTKTVAFFGLPKELTFAAINKYEPSSSSLKVKSFLTLKVVSFTDSITLSIVES